MKRIAGLFTAAVMSAGVIATIGAAPALAVTCTDAKSISPVSKSGSNATALSSICHNGSGATAWTGYASIERWRGTWWDTLGSEVPLYGVPNTIVHKTVTRSCAGFGTYTYRGRIWETNGITASGDEYSAERRFVC